MIGQGRPTTCAWIAVTLWLATALPLVAQQVRAPGDSLRISTQRELLIFAPGETFSFDLEPVLAGVEPSTTIDIETTLTPARSRATLWSTQQRLPVPVEGPAVATLHVPMPRQEGVYEIRLSVTRPPGFRERFFPGGSAPLVERSFQVVVLDKIPPAPAGDAPWRPVLEIDPANPAWSTRLPDWTQIRRLPGVPRRPIGSVDTTSVSSAAGIFVELPPTPARSEPHWQAYPLSLDAVGAPHLLEIEYPDDREQHLGISIVEPDLAGRLVTIGRDSGVYVEGLGTAESTGKNVHGLIFWPRTSTPYVLVTNQHPTAPGRFGRIRVSKRTYGSLAREPWAVSPPSGRLVAAYLSRPLQSEAAIPSANDWRSLYEGSVRLAEYLNYAGYNAAVINVMAAGAPIFVRERSPITPIAADVPGPDGLGLMLSVFDRCGMALLPALEFTATLPELEAIRVANDKQSSGIELVGPDGRTWQETHAATRGAAPHYNLLDDRVQRAMLALVGEIVERYGNHRSLSGLAVRLSDRGYAVLPGLEWGLDDRTMAQFERETGLRLPDDGPDRFAVRHELLLGDYADAWQAWRAARVTRFYQQLAELVTSGDSRRQLLLTSEELLANTEAANKPRPALANKTPLDEIALNLGIDWLELQRTPGIVVLPTEYVESMVPLVDRAEDLALNEAFAAIANSNRAALFYHRPQRQSFTSFDALSPFASHAQLVTQSSAHGPASRKPYVAALANGDPTIVVDGGEFVPLGQEEAQRKVREIMRALPAAAAIGTQREGNVTVRSYIDRGQLVCLVINECPWRADVALDVVTATPAEAKPLVVHSTAKNPPESERFAAGRQPWSLELQPYDVHAVRFSSAGVEFENVRAEIGSAGKQELAAKTAELRDRDLTATPHYAGLENPGFEPVASDAGLHGWKLIGDSTQVVAELDATMPQDGSSCLYLANRGNGVATIESNSFPTPPTGQLVTWAFVRGENIAPTTEFRIVFEVDDALKPYRQEAKLGGERSGATPLTNDWGRGYTFRREDLPLDSRGQMRLKFELVGPGEVWIDNVQLYDLLFPLSFYERSEPERLEFVKLISAAENELDQGKYAECARRLDGYWPRFLNAYTPLARPAVVVQPAQQAPPPAAAEKEKAEETPSVGRSWFGIPSLWR